MKEENRLKEGTGESRRMLDRWTLELANWLMSEKDMGRRESFRAFAAWRLVEMKGMKK